ncbi:type II toxin-antitoxin system RelE/ParE family toxin [Rhizobium sp. SL86]|uniref:type II toxin-antitoxin system RelE/ParE family toxin n=1 Tax=Rhizobium sp. SL86 TaxID=2995148 RepID=UPI003FA346E0
MRLRFAPDAVADLDELRTWLKPRSPQGHRNVVSAITKTIRTLQQHPDTGRATSRPDIREAVEPRYGFIIPYSVRNETLWIPRVYSARRYPLDFAGMRSHLTDKPG